MRKYTVEFSQHFKIVFLNIISFTNLVNFLKFLQKFYSGLVWQKDKNQKESLIMWWQGGFALVRCFESGKDFEFGQNIDMVKKKFELL